MDAKASEWKLGEKQCLYNIKYFPPNNLLIT